jgi:uncharacterized protein YndB with AHSA1/START domain
MTETIELAIHEKREEFMGTTYERTFTVAVPVAKAWAAFTEPRGREAWMSPPGRDPIEHPDVEYPAPGFGKAELKVGSVEEGRRLRWSQRATMPSGSSAWVDTTVTFEATVNGTRLTITRSGFGDSDDWELFAQSTGLGWDDSLIDLVAYLEMGVNVSRHFSGRSSIGASMRETAAGIWITRVVSGGFAAEAGLKEGDLLVSIGGAGIYRRSDVWLLQREHGPGEEMEATYVREGALRRGTGRLSEKNYTETHGGFGA